jgi:hypothetical protein
MKKRVFVLVILIAFVCADFAFSQGCSQCKLISEQSSEAGEASFASNINKGILLLMAMPYIILLIALRKRIFRFFKKFSSTKENIAQ